MRRPWRSHLPAIHRISQWTLPPLGLSRHRKIRRQALNQQVFLAIGVLFRVFKMTESDQGLRRARSHLMGTTNSLGRGHTRLIPWTVWIACMKMLRMMLGRRKSLYFSTREARFRIRRSHRCKSRLRPPL